MTGREAGAEATINALYHSFQEDKTKAVFLAYAKNAFHSINRKASLHLTYQLRVLYYQHLCQTATEFQRDSLFWGKN